MIRYMTIFRGILAEKTIEGNIIIWKFTKKFYGTNKSAREIIEEC